MDSGFRRNDGICRMGAEHTSAGWHLHPEQKRRHMAGVLGYRV